MANDRHRARTKLEMESIRKGVESQKIREAIQATKNRLLGKGSTERRE